MSTPGAMLRGRDAFHRQEWERAYVALSGAGAAASLPIDDLQRLVMSCYLLGRYDEGLATLEQAHHAFLSRGDIPAAARAAFWLGMILILDRGEGAQGGGWLARAHTLLADSPADCVERGYLLIPFGIQAVETGDAPGAADTFSAAAEIAARFSDRDLAAMARLGRGQSLFNMGQTATAMSLLDEAMVSVTTGEVSPVVSGIVYCGVIDLCTSALDFRRAQEWTAALTRWCDDQAGLVAFRGQCLVYRAEIMQLRGSWPDAMDEAERARERLAGNPAVGVAYYRQAELYRLRGEFAKAEEAYARASEWGRKPDPGLAQLRLAQERVDAAVAVSNRTLGEATDPVTRANLLPSHVEIMLAAGDVSAARRGAEELAKIAGERDVPMLHALADRSHGAVLLAEGDPLAALQPLRGALDRWRELDVPYEAARVRVLIGRACRELGDEDTARLEFDAARSAFHQLGAVTEFARTSALARTRGHVAPGGLSPREVEVLRLIAAGKTNRAIAGELFISQKTVARHVSNVFTKLGITSRAAATAYAYEHQLLER